MKNSSVEREKVPFRGNFNSNNIACDIVSDAGNNISAERNSAPFTRIEFGLDFIMRHFLPEEVNLWPRTISTKTTEGSQILVYSKQEALAWYKAANYLDCTIGAYPRYTDFYIKRAGVTPSLIFIDLDLGRFGFDKSKLDRELRRTLRNIKTIFEDDNVIPSSIWSGNGYHIYLPVAACPLEHEPRFYNLTIEPSRRFLQFAEEYLSNKKCDPCHNKVISFKNCMLRVPESINSKNSVEVKIIQEWNGYRPTVKPLMFRFYLYLLGLKSDQIHHRRHYRDDRRYGYGSSYFSPSMEWRIRNK